MCMIRSWTRRQSDVEQKLANDQVHSLCTCESQVATPLQHLHQLGIKETPLEKVLNLYRNSKSFLDISVPHELTER